MSGLSTRIANPSETRLAKLGPTGHDKAARLKLCVSPGFLPPSLGTGPLNV